MAVMREGHKCGSHVVTPEASLAVTTCMAILRGPERLAALDVHDGLVQSSHFVLQHID